MKKALSRMKFKVWDLIDGLHFKSINFLLNNYDIVLLPTFETSKMVARSNRKDSLQNRTRNIVVLVPTPGRGADRGEEVEWPTGPRS
jgi:hypothetical protein